MVPLYRCKSPDADKFPASAYIAQQAGSWGRLGSKEEAMKQTKKWWDDNMSTQAKEYYVLERV